MQLTVIKIGGNIIDDRDTLTAFLGRFHAISGYKILVHGGGKIATDIGMKLGITPNYVNGRRITDQQTLDLVTMVYGGLINKNIVAALQSKGCNAIGLSGADGGVLPAVKRPVKDVDYGFVGDVVSENINGALINTLLHAGLVPVFAPLSYTVEGSILNTNADTIAQEITKKMAAFLPVRLIYCFEKNGVLADAADNNSVITAITGPELQGLIEQGIVSGGMIPKLENAFEAIRKGVSQVIIGNADDLQALMEGKAGTCIQ